jgi:hypothetical protein
VRSGDEFPTFSHGGKTLEARLVAIEEKLDKIIETVSDLRGASVTWTAFLSFFALIIAALTAFAQFNH